MLLRITLSKNKDGEIEIWLNETGRDLLVRELVRLAPDNDHFHLVSDDAGAEVPPQDSCLSRKR